MLFLVALPRALTQQLLGPFAPSAVLVPCCRAWCCCCPSFVEKPDSCVASEGRDSRTALRVGLVTLRGVRVGEELFAPYVALGQSVEDRRRELCSRFFPDRAAAASATRAAATRGTGAMTTATSPSLSSSSLPPQQQLLICSCARCLFEAGDDHRSYGRDILKVRYGFTTYEVCRSLPTSQGLRWRLEGVLRRDD